MGCPLVSEPNLQAALISGAQELFVSKGYFATGTEEIVAKADVGTRSQSEASLMGFERPCGRQVVANEPQGVLHPWRQ